MSFSNDFNTMEVRDDIQNLLFLCDRLSNRLTQVASYVDQVKQNWLNKQRSIESDSNVSSLIAQKANRCNRVLLNVAEKLTVVELQTESLHNLHSSISKIASATIENHLVHITTCPPTPVVNHSSLHTLPSTMSNGLHSRRDMLPVTESSSTTGTRSSMNTFTARNTSVLFSATASVKTPTEQQQFTFQRPSSVLDNIGVQQTKLSPDSSFTSHLSHYRPLSKIGVNESVNGQQQRISNPSESCSSTMVNGSNGIDSKVRAKLQIIPIGTIWQNADIPIVDHPSAFFVSNQDPRVAEQFNMMSIEMNNYYSKPANTSVPLQNISNGDFCVTRFSEDHLWYRARVVLNNNQSVLVVFVDYGNSESKQPHEIYPLTEALARLPAMTVACTLNEAFPSNENFWTQEATETFNMIVKSRIVEVHFQQGVGHQWPLHFVKVMLDGQSIAQHPKLAPYIIPAQNEQIALHFNDKLTPVEYILYNVAVVESDIYNNNLP